MAKKSFESLKTPLQIFETMQALSTFAISNNLYVNFHKLQIHSLIFSLYAKIKK